MAKKKIQSVFGYLVSAVLAAILLFLVFHNISFDEFVAQAEKADYSWVCLSIGITLIAHMARAYRWNLLIRPTGYTATLLRTTAAVLIGYIVNLVLPRLGEITRCGVLKKTNDIPMTISLGTVISERIIDVASLLLITIATLAFEFDKLSSFLMGLFVHIDRAKLFTLGLVCVAALLLLAVAGIFIYNRLQGKFRVVLDQLLEGIFSLRRMENVSGFILATLLIWTTYYFMGYLVFFAVEQTSPLGWQAALMLLVTGGIAMTIPVQGGFGTFHSIVSAMLLLYGIDSTTGVFFATLVHSSQVAATVIFGVMGLLITLFLKNHSPEKQPKK